MNANTMKCVSMTAVLFLLCTVCIAQESQPVVQTGRVSVDGEIQNWEREVFSTTSPDRLRQLAIEIERNANRRAATGGKRYSQMLRLAATAYSRAGINFQAARLCKRVTEAPETSFDGATAWRMLGNLRANKGLWADAEEAYTKSLAYWEAGGYEEGRLLYTSLRGLVGSLRAQEKYRSAVEKQEAFLKKYFRSLVERDRISLLRLIAGDAIASGDVESGIQASERLLLEYPEWGVKDGSRVLFQLQVAARGDRNTERTKPAYASRLQVLWEESMQRKNPVVLVVGAEIALTLAEQGKRDEALKYRMEILEIFLQQENAWGDLRHGRTAGRLAARIALYDTVSRLFVAASDDDSGVDADTRIAASLVLIDLFPTSRITAEAQSRLDATGVDGAASN